MKSVEAENIGEFPRGSLLNDRESGGDLKDVDLRLSVPGLLKDTTKLTFVFKTAKRSSEITPTCKYSVRGFSYASSEASHTAFVPA